MNNQKLESSMKSIHSETVKLNEVIPFEWDSLYTFKPYESRENIEEVIGFKSAYIEENNINEGMVYLLFVKDEKVICNVVGYSQDLGYDIDFVSEVAFAEDAEFDVIKTEDVTTLTYIK
ncbi:MAG: hypothetical protein ACK5I7_08735 [Anaerotignum sp.]